MKNKFFPLPNVNPAPLVTQLERFFRANNHEVQILPLDNGQVVQAQKETTFSALTGQSSALTIKIETDGQGLHVDVGSSKWIDKAAVGVVGYILLPPLAIIPMIGMYNQYKLGEEVWRIVEAFVARTQAEMMGGQQHNANYGYQGYQSYQSYNANANPQPQADNKPKSDSSYNSHCPSCYAWIAPGAGFCSNCGSQVHQSRPSCKKCGTSNQPGARFCSGCGGRFE